MTVYVSYMMLDVRNLGYFFQDKGVVGNKKSTRDASDGSKDFSLLVYNSLLKNEILGTGIEDFKEAAAHSNAQNGIAGM